MMLYYLAVPYTQCPDGPEAAYSTSNAICAELMDAGMHIFSPITHSHPLVDCLGEECRFSHEFWMRIDKVFVDKCDALIVCCLPGWRESKGMQQEIAWFREQGKPVKCLSGDVLASWEIMETELAPWIEDY